MTAVDHTAGATASPVRAAAQGDRRRVVAEPADRGGLDIDAGVVEKIATAAAREVDAIGGAARRVLTVALGSDATADHARVAAHVDGQVVTLAVTCSVAYPHSVVATTQRLREHLVTRITALTALQVRQVDITVAALTGPQARGAGKRERRDLA